MVGKTPSVDVGGNPPPKRTRGLVPMLLREAEGLPEAGAEEVGPSSVGHPWSAGGGGTSLPIGARPDWKPAGEARWGAEGEGAAPEETEDVEGEGEQPQESGEGRGGASEEGEGWNEASLAGDESGEGVAVGLEDASPTGAGDQADEDGAGGSHGGEEGWGNGAGEEEEYGPTGGTEEIWEEAGGEDDWEAVLGGSEQAEGGSTGACIGDGLKEEYVAEGGPLVEPAVFPDRESSPVQVDSDFSEAGA